MIELEAETPAGARLVACAESLAPRLGENAQRAEAAGQYPMANVGLLQRADYFVAPVPACFGGRGVDSVHDLLIASSRLARQDASTTLGLNMHLLIVSNIVRRWQVASHRGLERRAAAYARSLEQIVAERRVIAAAISEPNQDLTRPSACATRGEHGWVLSGHKIFCTMSPAATILLTSVTYAGADDQLLYGY